MANPNLPTFGTDRTVKFQLNAPAQLVGGIGWTPSELALVALDGKQIFYEDTEGFKDVLGLRGHHGLSPWASSSRRPRMLRPARRLQQRRQPDRSERVFFTVPVPAVFEDHITAGLGIQVTESLTAEPRLLPRVREPGRRPASSRPPARSRAAGSRPRWRWTRWWRPSLSVSKLETHRMAGRRRIRWISESRGIAQDRGD